MSMYASAIQDDRQSKTIRQSQIPKEKLLGMAEAKRQMIKSGFKLGDNHDGNLDDMVIRGSNVLRQEINHAKSIP